MEPQKYFCVRIKHGVVTILSNPTDNYEAAKRIFDQESAIESGVKIVATVYG